MNYTKVEQDTEKWDTARTIIDNLSCHENGLKSFSHPGVEQLMVMDTSPKNPPKYYRILQQGANGHRVHVKPIKEFHHLIQRRYRSDPGVDELMKIRLARTWSHLHTVYDNQIVDCGELYRYLSCCRYISRLIMEKINFFRSFHFTLFTSWFSVREEQFIMECKVVVGTVSMLEAEEVLFIVSRKQCADNNSSHNVNHSDLHVGTKWGFMLIN
uniref:Uncharacterized protein n=1 Tax=Romanomermis culicivorax TaxID=13658 RepID=A0A915JYY7_ROMCU